MVEHTKADKIIYEMSRQNHYERNIALWMGLWINSLWFWLRFRRDVKLFWAILVHAWQTRETSEKDNKWLYWTFQLSSFLVIVLSCGKIDYDILTKPKSFPNLALHFNSSTCFVSIDTTCQLQWLNKNT